MVSKKGEHKEKLIKGIFRREERHSLNKKWWNCVHGIACDTTK